MQVQYKDTYSNMIDGQWRSPQCTVEGILKVSVDGGGSGGDASAANQLDQIAAEEAIQTAVESIDVKTPDLGQAVMAASVPVVIASDQSPVTITGSVDIASTAVPFDVIVTNTPSAPVVFAGVRAMKRYTSGVPSGGIDCTSEIPGYAHPAHGFLINDGSLLDFTLPLAPSTSVTLDVGAGYWWDDFQLQAVNDTSTLTDFYLYWK